MRKMMFSFFLSFALIGTAPAILGQSADSPALMPSPAHITRADGQLLIDSNFHVDLQGYTEPRLVAAKTRFLHLLFRETGIPLVETATSGSPILIVQTAAASDPVQQLGEDNRTTWRSPRAKRSFPPESARRATRITDVSPARAGNTAGF